MKVTRKRRVQKRTVKKGGGLGTNNRPLDAAWNTYKKSRKIFSNVASDLGGYKINYENEYKCRETFKMLMLLFKKMNIDTVNKDNYLGFIKNLVGERVLEENGINETDFTKIFNNQPPQYHPMIKYIIRQMAKNIIINQSKEEKGNKNFYYKIVLNNYGPFVGYYRVSTTWANKNQDALKRELIPENISEYTNATFYIYPYRKRFGATNLHLIITDTIANKNVYDKWYRFHYDEKKDKMNEPIDIPYGMTKFRDFSFDFDIDNTDATDFPEESVEESNIGSTAEGVNATDSPALEETNTSVEPPSEFVEESNPETNQDPALGISEEAPEVVNISTNYEGAPDFENKNETLGGRRRRKTRKSRKRSKKTKKGRRRKSV